MRVAKLYIQNCLLLLRLSSRDGLRFTRFALAIHGFNERQVTQVAIFVAKSSDLTDIRHDRSCLPLEKRVVSRPNIHDVFCLRTADGHHLLSVANNLSLLEKFWLHRLLAFRSFHFFT